MSAFFVRLNIIQWFHGWPNLWYIFGKKHHRIRRDRDTVVFVVFVIGNAVLLF